jgi:hypothetical protein
MSITDPWSTLKYLWLMPSRSLLSIVECDFAHLLGIDCLTGEYMGGLVFSGVAWLLILCAFTGIALAIAKWRNRRKTRTTH